MRFEGATVVLECDCHQGGHEVTMAKVREGLLVIIARHHGLQHSVSVPLDKLQALCVSLEAIEQPVAK